MMRLLPWGAVAAMGILAAVIVCEARGSRLQSHLLTAWARDLAFAVQPGAAPDAQFPAEGPYDERLGYTSIPSFVDRLQDKGFAVTQQAAPSEGMQAFVAGGGYAIYREKNQAGLRLVDRAHKPIFTRAFPELTYNDFASVPPLVANTLLYIEDRDLLDPESPYRNPSVVWDRFIAAAAGRIPGLADVVDVRGGASTLATQIEKFRHSPGGRTDSAQEKLRQMISASMRAYMDGPDTTAARRRIVVTYLNATPLGSRPGYGEIIGIADGLSVWYGTSFAEANKVLADPSPSALARKGEIYRQVLSLLLAQRRPSYYLGGDRAPLEALADRYLRLMHTGGVIDTPLFTAARAARLKFRPEPPAPAPVSFTDRKAANAIRTDLLKTLGVSGLYSLDRMDLSVQTTIDREAQTDVARLLKHIGTREGAVNAGLRGPNLLENADPGKVAYSVVLYERGQDYHAVRIHADSLDQPFNLNTGGKLILGSTAKLRTTATYLNIIADLHGRYAGATREALREAAQTRNDPLTAWAADYLLTARDRGLQPMLDAAMQRRYSASPYEGFFTGGGLHHFTNFKKEDNTRIVTVAQALRHSINLPFIRVMRDITRHYLARDAAAVPAEATGERREAYLRRFADKEGSVYLNRFYDDHRGLSADQALSLLAGRSKTRASSLAVVFRTVRPNGTAAELAAFLKEALPTPIDDEDVAALHAKYAPDKFSLNDRGYIAGIHPLELWLAAYLQAHPAAALGEVLRASADERQAVYSWLFKTSHKRRQDFRIQILREEEAFNHLLRDWRRQGYPFAQVTPSYATAIGSSGDRPDALARLMGIIVNDGVDIPIATVEQLSFAAGTPFETQLALATPASPQRVFAPEVARTLRRALAGVVEGGTAVRLHNTFHSADGTPLEVGGKTGTGDNRFKTFDAGGNLIESRAVDRTATFAFFIGERFFGTITAYVAGPDADKYAFTSSLSLQVLKNIAPIIQRLMEAPVERDAGIPSLHQAMDRADDTAAVSAVGLASFQVAR